MAAQLLSPLLEPKEDIVDLWMVWNLLVSMPNVFWKQHLFMPKTMGAVICNGRYDICGGTNSFLVVYIYDVGYFSCSFIWCCIFIMCADVYIMHFVWSENIPTIYIFFKLLWEEKFDWIRGRYVWGFQYKVDHSIWIVPPRILSGPASGSQAPFFPSQSPLPTFSRHHPNSSFSNIYSVYNYSPISLKQYLLLSSLTRFREVISHIQFINFRSRSTL